MGNFKQYSITGDKAIYVGSQKCIKCHAGLTISTCREMVKDKI